MSSEKNIPHIDPTTADAYFVRTAPSTTSATGERTSYVLSTPHAQGAWQEDELHMAAVSGLVAAEIEAFTRRTANSHFLTSRVSFDILGKLHVGEQIVRTRVIRPGRTIELLETNVTSGGRVSLSARTWRVMTGDLSRAVRDYDSQIAPLAPLEECEPEASGFGERWPGGFIKTIKERAAAEHGPGHGRIWLSTDLQTVAGELTSPFVRMLSVADCANGVAPTMEPFAEKISFANVDLTVHFYREPVGEWLGLATSSSSGATGGGMTWAVLHDTDGPFGHLAQSQTVRDVSG